MDVYPGVGAGPARLGMAQSDVLAAVGEPESRRPDWLGVGETWFWHERAFQVAFGGDGLVGDIQICAGGPVRAEWRGLDLLHTPAPDVTAALATLGEGFYDEDGYSYRIPAVRLSFWRQCLPGDEADEDEQYRGGRYWDTVNTWRLEYEQELQSASAARRAR